MDLNQKEGSPFLNIFLAIIIALILFCILVLAYFQGRGLAQDKVRIANLERTTQALRLFYKDHLYYPETLSELATPVQYISYIPNEATTSCKGDNNLYTYKKINADSFTLKTCIINPLEKFTDNNRDSVIEVYFTSNSQYSK